jgi:imidazole glycerol-phosphate synthase subunit HisH
LRRLDLVDVLRRKVLVQRVPLLGICLGMQLLTESSEEGEDEGLAVIPAVTVRFAATAQARITVPHMGWNTLTINRDNPILPRDDQGYRFYFVHSYHVMCREQADVIATAHHGTEFVAAYQRQNVFGVQFHPEKSHRFGMALLQRFSSV